MHWIIQDNLFKEEGFAGLMDCMERMKIPHDVVKVIPFDNKTYPDVNPTGLVMACGSISLAKIAKAKGWNPGSFMNENHTYQIWVKNYGENLLNFDSKVCKFGEVSHDWDDFFIRPCEDTKAFSGKVYDWDNFKSWRDNVSKLTVEEEATLSMDTMVSYCRPKNIYQEYRWFVVDGKVITGSTYPIKKHSKVTSIDPDAKDYAQRMVDMWQPARAFVIDTCILDAGNNKINDKIVEVNCINSAGFYNIDMQKFVNAIEDMKF